MIRYTLLALAVVYLSAYAWRDWFKSLCGLIVFMAFVRHESMPGAMFGIPGISPFNFILANILLAAFAAKKKEQLQWDLPSNLKIWLYFYGFIVFITVIRYLFNDSAAAAYWTMIDMQGPSAKSILFDHTVNSIKWIIPGLLLFWGCNSRERFTWAMIALMVMYLLLALLVIRWMPLGYLVDGDALQKRALRVLGQEIGFYRTNLSIMLAGAFWIFIAAQSYFAKKHSLILYGMAAITFLGMALTGGRAGYLAWALAGFVLCCFRWRGYLFFAPPLVIVVLIFVPSVTERIMTGLGGNSSPQVIDYEAQAEQMSNLSAGRSSIWPETINLIKERPLLGHGFHAFITQGGAGNLYKVSGTVVHHPHNAYLQLLADAGIAGLVPVVLFFLLVLKYSWRLFRDSSDPIYVFAGGAALSMVMTVLLGSLTGQSFYPVERSAGLWCAMCLAVRVYVERSKLGVTDHHKKKRHKETNSALEPAGQRIWSSSSA